MDKYFMWIHYERLRNHNKAKHNKSCEYFLGYTVQQFPLWKEKYIMATFTPLYTTYEQMGWCFHFEDSVGRYTQPMGVQSVFVRSKHY